MDNANKYSRMIEAFRRKAAEALPNGARMALLGTRARGVCVRAVYMLLALLASLLPGGCMHRGHDPRLEHIAGMVSDKPVEALVLLDSIGYDRLSEPDRHLFDFLSIKARDKAYIRHKSDSLILDVIAYYGGSDLYPEALYYGGRVYSDMGDYPSSLKYLQEALSATESETDLPLRVRILSQTARLLNKLRLYSDAIPLLEEALHIDSIRDDAFCLAYDNQMMGCLYLNSHKPGKARKYFLNAARWASGLSPEHRANMTVYLAACELEEGNIESARALIRTAMDSVSPQYRNLALSYASDIYLRSNIPDTAFIYALRLANSDDSDNRRFGYRNLLSPELIPLSSTESLIHYVSDYHKILTEDYNVHEAQQAIMQRSLYNYQIHERERIKAETSRERVIFWLVFSIFLIMTVVMVFLIYRIRIKHTIIRLHETIARLDTIRQMMADNPATNSEETSGIDAEAHAATVMRGTINTELDSSVGIAGAGLSDPKSLREQLKQKISLIDTNATGRPVPEIISNSHAFRTLKKYAEEKRPIPDSDPVWNELHALILQSSPDFENKLHILAGTGLKQHEMHTIILVKCGITPTEMTYILGKTKGSISSRRESIGQKLLGTKTSVRTIDAIIRSL